MEQRERYVRRLGSSGRLDFVLLIFLSLIFLSVSYLRRRIGKAPTEKCRTEKLAPSGRATATLEMEPLDRSKRLAMKRKASDGSPMPSSRLAYACRLDKLATPIHHEETFSMVRYRLLVVGIVHWALLVLWTIGSYGAEPFTGPWNLESLKRPPQAEFGPREGLLQTVYYQGEPLQGKPTRVFAYLGRPAEGEGPFPAVVLVHGGGGKAFSAWAEHWAKRGYVALAMDLAGHGPAGKLSDGGPDQSDTAKFRDFSADMVRDMWTYHAVAAVIRGHSLLAAQPFVDAKRTALTGISWGGYLTCIVAGLDDRFQAAVPVYGCGFLHENSVWTEPKFRPMTPDLRERWVANFDPSRYLPSVRCPILFLNGTNDFAYPLDSYKKSYSLVASPVTVSVQVRLPHGHIWTFPEVDHFIDSAVRSGDSVPQCGPLELTEDRASASAVVKSKRPIKQSQLHFTTDVGPWQKRTWQSADAEFQDGVARARLPEGRPLVCFLAVKDDRGVSVSTPHVELPAP